MNSNARMARKLHGVHMHTIVLLDPWLQVGIHDHWMYLPEVEFELVIGIRTRAYKVLHSRSVHVVLIYMPTQI